MKKLVKFLMLPRCALCFLCLKAHTANEEAMPPFFLSKLGGVFECTQIIF